MKYLRELNLKEIALLKQYLGITINRSKGTFELEKSIEANMIIKLCNDLLNEIWSSKNTALIKSELNEDTPERSRLHYFSNGNPAALDGYLSKMGILNYEILIEDPLCFPITVKPTHNDHFFKNPTLYIQHIFENALFMVYLEDWIKNGYLYFVPSLPLIDIKAFWELYNTSERLSKLYDYQKTKGFNKSMKLGMVESSIRISLSMLRLSKNNYTKEHIKRMFTDITDKEAEAILFSFKDTSLEDRERTAIDFAFSKFALKEDEKHKLLTQFSRSRPFNIERFLNIDTINGSMLQSTGMPLLHATFISKLMQCIPSTDCISQMYGYEGWCEALGQNMDDRVESVRAKVDLPFAFFDNISLDAVQKIRKDNIGLKTSIYLEENWKKIRVSKDLDTYKANANEFANKVSMDLVDLEKQRDQLINNTFLDIYKKMAYGAGAIIAADIITEFPVIIAGTLITILTATVDTYQKLNQGKKELEANPISVFLMAKDEVN